MRGSDHAQRLHSPQQIGAEQNQQVCKGEKTGQPRPTADTHEIIVDQFPASVEADALARLDGFPCPDVPSVRAAASASPLADIPRLYALQQDQTAGANWTACPEFRSQSDGAVGRDPRPRFPGQHGRW